MLHDVPVNLLEQDLSRPKTEAVVSIRYETPPVEIEFTLLIIYFATTSIPKCGVTL